MVSGTNVVVSTGDFGGEIVRSEADYRQVKTEKNLAEKISPSPRKEATDGNLKKNK